MHRHVSTDTESKATHFRRKKNGFVVTRGTSNSTHLDGGLRHPAPRGAGLVTLQRAHGGCLGTRRRRRTRKPAISHGELDSSFDPWISEWGNPAGVMARHRALNT